MLFLKPWHDYMWLPRFHRGTNCVPKYTYRCESCDSVFEYYHSASDTIKNCKSCGLDSVLNKVPGSFLVLMEEEAGNIVKNSIQEFKEELETEKQSLKNQTWSTDE